MVEPVVQHTGTRNQRRRLGRRLFRPRGAGGKESNWVPTRPGEHFEVLFRLYGPDKPLFDKTWVLPDIEKVS